ncbi:MAG: acyl-CoA/acyl-ACP dehydrogenase [Thermoleophilia bacterium]|nr:acyl-CoA/acyl-ACP dehydrogenase [Thermoleophilia bacterium]
MDFGLTEDQEAIRAAVKEVCARFPDEYWRAVDARGDYPQEFVTALTESGWLAVLIPEEYGGAGLGLVEAGIVLEEINRSGGNGGACHAQMYTMGTLLRHGSDEQKRRYLPEIAEGRLRLQAFAVTEPTTGSDTTRLVTRAERRGGGYVVNGQKVFISRAEHSDLMLLLARTTPLEEVESRSHGLSVFLVDLREARGAVEIRPLEVMVNHHTCEVFMNDLELPAESLIGEEGLGLRYIMDGMNAERILIASESVGDGRWFVERGARYASEREVFGRPIGANQGVQFPLAQAYAEVEAASLVRFHAATLFDAGEPCGPQANMAKLLGSQASWHAANACMSAHGGYGFAREYDVERKFREAKLLEIAPVSNNLVLAHIGQRVLGLPRSY